MSSTLAQRVKCKFNGLVKAVVRRGKDKTGTKTKTNALVIEIVIGCIYKRRGSVEVEAYLVLCLVLSCLALSGLVLSCLDLSCLVLS